MKSKVASRGVRVWLSPGHLDYMRRELWRGGGVHVLLQILSEEFKYQVQLLPSVDHIQQSGGVVGWGGVVSLRLWHLGSQHPFFPLCVVLSV